MNSYRAYFAGWLISLSWIDCTSNINKFELIFRKRKNSRSNGLKNIIKFMSISVKINHTKHCSGTTKESPTIVHKVART